MSRMPTFKSMFMLPLLDECLTVLCYHRIGYRSEHYQGYRPNFSASPESFALQMKFIRAFLNPVSLSDVVKWVEEGIPLPRRPVLVTFDDGYKDNGDVAWPIMRDLGIPGVVFVATDHIGSPNPFLWDFVAYCFEATKAERICSSLLGEKRLASQADRQKNISLWIEAAKRLPAKSRWDAARLLASELNVSPPSDAFANLYLSWEDLRRLDCQGLEFGGHTCSHPILTKVSLDEARAEIVGCQERLTVELKRPALGFAYPNGSRWDYAEEHERMVRDAGFSIAFTLERGSTSFSEIQQGPMAVRRHYVGAQDGRVRLFAKVVGADRLLAR
jgi:peptidoglycan/xylan/chitin deacetylase (PgdA/CDA1 family)